MGAAAAMAGSTSAAAAAGAASAVDALPASLLRSDASDAHVPARSGGGGGGGSVWSSLTSMIWGEAAPIEELPAYLRSSMTLMVHRFRPQQVFLMSKLLCRESLGELLKALVLARDPVLRRAEASKGGKGDPSAAALCIELLSHVYQVCSDRAADIWPLLHAFLERLLTSQALRRDLVLERATVCMFTLTARLIGHSPELDAQLASTLHAAAAGMRAGEPEPVALRIVSGCAHVALAACSVDSEPPGSAFLFRMLRSVASGPATARVRESSWKAVEAVCRTGAFGASCVAELLEVLSQLSRTSQEETLRALAGMQDAALGLMKAGSAGVASRGADSCWLSIVGALASFIPDSRTAVRRATYSSLQRVFLSPWLGAVPSKSAIVAAFTDVLIPAAELEVNRRDEEGRLRACALLTRAFLHNSTLLVESADTHRLWLRIVTALCADVRAGGAPAEASAELVKNLVLVGESQGVVDAASRASGADVRAATWHVLETASVALRDSIQQSLAETTGSAERAPSEQQQQQGESPS